MFIYHNQWVSGYHYRETGDVIGESERYMVSPELQTEDFKAIMFHIQKQSTQSHVHFTYKYHELLLYHSLWIWVVFGMVFQELWSAEFTSPFTWKVISKKYFSWTAMRTHSPIHLFESAINFNSFSIIFITIIGLQFIFIFIQPRTIRAMFQQLVPHVNEYMRLLYPFQG